MAGKQHLSVFLCVSLLAQTLCIPTDRIKMSREIEKNQPHQSKEMKLNTQLTTTEWDSFDDDDDMNGELMLRSSTRSPNILSLLSQITSLSSNSNVANSYLWNIARQFLGYNGAQLFLRRKDVADNEIEIDEVNDLKPPPLPSPTLQKAEKEELSSSESEEDSNETDEKDNDSDNASTSSDEDDEPPEGDGQGGGVLGILAGLSGGEDGESDLGSLLATISSIVVNLSGDGIDVNALIASGLGLFVGLLSEGEENPGAVIGSYLLTSLDTLTGGGAQNNGAFFGNLVSKLVKGTSAVGDADGSDEGNGGNQMADSAGFFLSLIMSLLGDMSKSSSGGSSQSSRRYEQIRRIYQADRIQNK